jgi:site-specific DNA-methyltransferase (adenine-specific)
VKSSGIRDLLGTVEGENAAIGVFITLLPPTQDMITAALKAGFYHSLGWWKDYLRIQILTIAELFKGVKVKMPPYETFRQAQKVKP